MLQCILSACQEGTPKRTNVPEVENAGKGGRRAVPSDEPTPAASSGSIASESNNSNKVRMPQTGFKFMDKALGKAQDKVSAKVAEKTGKSADQWFEHAKDTVTKVKQQAVVNTADLRAQLTTQFDTALATVDSGALNQLLDSAIASKLLDEKAPPAVKKAAGQIASRQLQEAIDSEEPQRLKGALIAAKRLSATSVPEFEAAVAKYQEVRKLPPGWDISKMVLHREGSKMVAKLIVEDPAIKAKFQLLLDATARQVYTRDRMGQPVPERLELVAVRAITNEDVWGDYMARRETVRQELIGDDSDFQQYGVDTIVTAADAPKAAAGSDTVEEVSARLAADFAEPLLPEVNEVFLFHGTNEDAAHKITTGNVRVNLAGSNTGTLYGRGVYFAESATKSDEYTWPINGVRHMLLCRVILGRVLYSDSKETDPRACEGACLGGKYHSVLGDRKKVRGTFREFVVFDEEQVYPNYILDYRRIDGPVDPKKSVQVQCPADAKAGQTIQFTAASGQQVSVTVPAGVKPGQTFNVQY